MAESDSDVEAALIRIGAKIVSVVRLMVGVVVVALVGITTWVVQTDSKLENLAIDVKVIREVTVLGIDKRLRALEIEVGREILPRAEVEIERLRGRLSDLENTR